MKSEAENIPREYTYPRFFRVVQKVALGLTVAIAVLTVALVCLIHPAMLAMTLPYIIGLMVVSIVYDRFATAKFVLANDGIRMVGRAKDIFIAYDEIEEISFSSMRYLGGWMKITSSSESLRFTVVLEDVSDLVTHLKRHVDRRCDTSPYNRDAMFGFLVTARQCENSWARFRAYGPTIFNTVLALATIGPWMALGFGTPQVGIATALFAGFVAYIGFLVGEAILMRDVSREADDVRFTVPERDPAREKRVLTWCGVITAVAILAGDVFLVSAFFG